MCLKRDDQCTWLTKKRVQDLQIKQGFGFNPLSKCNNSKGMKIDYQSQKLKYVERLFLKRTMLLWLYKLKHFSIWNQENKN